MKTDYNHLPNCMVLVPAEPSQPAYECTCWNKERNHYAGCDYGKTQSGGYWHTCSCKELVLEGDDRYRIAVRSEVENVLIVNNPRRPPTEQEIQDGIKEFIKAQQRGYEQRRSNYSYSRYSG